MSEARPASPAPVGEEDLRGGGRVVFRARRPAALVIPLAAVTETAGVLFLLNGATIGWFVCAAPAVALVATGLILRPSLELTREGLLQRQYPFSSLTRWEVIDAMGITRAGNRMVLAYRLVAGIPRRGGSRRPRFSGRRSAPTTVATSSIRWWATRTASSPLSRSTGPAPSGAPRSHTRGAEPSGDERAERLEVGRADLH